MLRAIGMRPGSIIVQVVLESSLLMFIGVAIGLLVGWLFILWLGDGIDLTQFAEGMESFGMRTIWKPVPLAGDVVLVAGLSLLFGVVASLYPAWRVVKIKPLEALRR
jgi:ABC-type antimicrobial peptide transport system permease subunit